MIDLSHIWAVEWPHPWNPARVARGVWFRDFSCPLEMELWKIRVNFMGHFFGFDPSED